MSRADLNTLVDRLVRHLEDLEGQVRELRAEAHDRLVRASEIERVALCTRVLIKSFEHELLERQEYDAAAAAEHTRRAEGGA